MSVFFKFDSLALVPHAENNDMRLKLLTRARTSMSNLLNFMASAFEFLGVDGANPSRVAAITMKYLRQTTTAGIRLAATIKHLRGVAGIGRLQD
jgi:hypothetical protein